MDDKLLLPILGVAIGWLLNTASAYSKYRLGYKIHSGKALAYLLIIQDQLAQINNNLEKLKDHVKSWGEFESLREYKMRRHFLAADELSQNVENAFIELAGYDPLFANHLLSIKNALAFHRTIKMSETVKLQEAYIEMLSSWETVMLLTEKVIHDDMMRLARQHSLVTWFKVRKRSLGLAEISECPRLNDVYRKYKDIRDHSSNQATDDIIKPPTSPP